MTGSFLFVVADAGAQTQSFKQSSVPGLALRRFPSKQVSLCSCGLYNCSSIFALT